MYFEQHILIERGVLFMWLLILVLIVIIAISLNSHDEKQAGILDDRQVEVRCKEIARVLTNNNITTAIRISHFEIPNANFGALGYTVFIGGPGEKINETIKSHFKADEIATMIVKNTSEKFVVSYENSLISIKQRK